MDATGTVKKYVIPQSKQSRIMLSSISVPCNVLLSARLAPNVKYCGVVQNIMYKKDSRLERHILIIISGLLKSAYHILENRCGYGAKIIHTPNNKLY
jgi:hypothetical protein